MQDLKVAVSKLRKTHVLEMKASSLQEEIDALKSALKRTTEMKIDAQLPTWRPKSVSSKGGGQWMIRMSFGKRS